MGMGGQEGGTFPAPLKHSLPRKNDCKPDSSLTQFNASQYWTNQIHAAFPSPTLER